MHVKYASRHWIYPVPICVAGSTGAEDARLTIVFALRTLDNVFFTLVLLGRLLVLRMGAAVRAMFVFALRAFVCFVGVVFFMPLLEDMVLRTAEFLVAVRLITLLPDVLRAVDCIFVVVAVFLMMVFSSRTAALAMPTPRNSVTRKSIFPFIPYYLNIFYQNVRI